MWALYGVKVIGFGTCFFYILNLRNSLSQVQNSCRALNKILGLCNSSLICDPSSFEYG